jgi:hypothetical protein
VPHWHRRTIEQYRAQREQPRVTPHPGSRPSGTPARRAAGELEAGVAELLTQAAASNRTLPTAQVTAELGMHYTTAHRYVSAWRSRRV